MPALEGFSPTPECPEIEEAQTLLARLAETDEVKSAAAARQRRLKLQTTYGRALAWSRGFDAKETRAAIARAQEMTASVTDADERFDGYYLLWVTSLARSELASSRETSEIFSQEAKSEGRATEAAVAHAFLGTTCLCQGDFTEGHANLVQALQQYDPARDRDAKYRFGVDTGATATALLAHTNWLLGNLGRVQEFMDEAVQRAIDSAHLSTQTEEIVTELDRHHGLAFYRSAGLICAGWAHARLDEREAGVNSFRQALADYTEQGNKVGVPFFQGLLAEFEAEAFDSDGALKRIDEALVLARETGQHGNDAALHRLRGEILLKRDPTNRGQAEESLLTAIVIAQ